jgi:hypothetical protein
MEIKTILIQATVILAYLGIGVVALGLCQGLILFWRKIK